MVNPAGQDSEDDGDGLNGHKAVRPCCLTAPCPVRNIQVNLRSTVPDTAR